jgi:hypothetical protein
MKLPPECFEIPKKVATADGLFSLFIVLQDGSLHRRAFQNTLFPPIKYGIRPHDVFWAGGFLTSEKLEQER